MATDAELGMVWWNNMTRQQRADALHEANTSVPAEAWHHWKATVAKPQEWERSMYEQGVL